MSEITSLVILNRALGRLGIEPLQDLDAEDFGGQSAALIFASIVDFCLGVYPWSWATEIRALQRLDETSGFGFMHLFDLPGDRLGPPIRVTDDARSPEHVFNRYVLSGDRVHADADPLFAVIKFRPPPHRWSATFREAVTLGLAAEVALAMADDGNLRQTLRADAFGSPSVFPRGGVLGTAIAEDAHATPARRAPVRRNPLTDAWRS